jgi:hypothetical protein
VGLAHGGVTEQSPLAAIMIVTDHEVEGGEHGYEATLELQENITPVDRGPVDGLNGGHSDLGGKVRVLCSGILDFYDVARCLFGGVGLVGLATYPAPCGRTLQLETG